jgi:hypothetical protein
MSPLIAGEFSLRAGLHHRLGWIRWETVDGNGRTNRTACKRIMLNLFKTFKNIEHSPQRDRKGETYNYVIGILQISCFLLLCLKQSNECSNQVTFCNAKRPVLAPAPGTQVFSGVSVFSISQVQMSRKTRVKGVVRTPMVDNGQFWSHHEFSFDICFFLKNQPFLFGWGKIYIYIQVKYW